MDALVTTEWLADELGAADLRVVDATYFGSVPGGPARDAAAEYRRGAYSRRGVPRPRQRSPTRRATCRRCCRRPSSSPSGCSRSGSATATASSSTTIRTITPRRAPGGCCARSARATSRSSTAGSPNGGPRGARSRAATEHSATAHFTARSDPRRRAHARPDEGECRERRRTGARRPLAPRASPAKSPIRAPARRRPHPGLAQPALWPACSTPTARGSAATRSRPRSTRPGIDLAKPLVTTCGSGITAAVLAFGAHLLGNDAALYDGSWSEWGADPSTPKATGAA